MILRFEDINLWENVLSNIFNIKFEITNKNLTENKKIYELYLKFKNEYKYSDEEIKLIDNIDHLIHFYSKKEIEDFKRKYN